MATIKSYSDLQQSKKLAKILPPESADMYWWSTSLRYYIEAMDDGDFNEEEGHIRAWSLAALLSIIRKTIGYIIYGINNVYISCERSDSRKIETDIYDNEVDACVAMVIKLSKLKLL